MTGKPWEVTPVSSDIEKPWAVVRAFAEAVEVDMPTATGRLLAAWLRGVAIELFVIGCSPVAARTTAGSGGVSI